MVGDEILSKEINGGLVVYAHNAPTLFGTIYTLSKNDVITIAKNNTIVTYRVATIEMNDKNDGARLDAVSADTLLLVTCSVQYPNKRIIIVAKKDATI